MTVNQSTGKIVYSNEGDVYVMNEDGSAVKHLTTNPAADFDHVWSPDGTQIAFRSHRDDNGNNEEVYIMNADGSDVTLISEPSCAGTDSGNFPDWYQPAK